VYGFLRKWGMEVSAAPHGLEALMMLRDAVHDDRPYDVILLDAHMPDMNGFEVARRILRDVQCNHTAVLMLSSTDLHPDAATCKSLGIQALLTKPIFAPELHAAIARALNHA